MKRIGSRNKLLACFRPDFHMEEMIPDDGLFLTRSKSAALLAVEKNSKPILHRSVSDCSALTAGVNSETSDSDDTTVVEHRIRKRKSFSRAVKSVVSDLFHSKSKNRRSRIRRSDLATRSDSDPEEHDATRKESCSSVLGSDPENNPTAGKIRRSDPEPEQKKAGNLTLFVLLLVSLAVTVLGGQLLGVALTSISLYSIPHRRVIVGGSSETECRRKQRVVMEGGMRKSHRRQNLQSMA